MKLAREIRLGMLVLIALNLLVSFGSITLLVRMAPAIEIIIKENVASIEAVQQMLASLATNGEGIEEALERATNNVTEPEEPAAIEEVRVNLPRARAGDAAAKANVVAALDRLGAINRAAMARSDDRAKRLGIAGAWSVVFLGFVGFLAGGIVLRRFLKRVSFPIEEISEVLSSWRHGEVQRRCRPIPGPVEITAAITSINSLLDDEVRPLIAKADCLSEEQSQARDRRIVHDLLNRLPQPAILLDSTGGIIATNHAAFRELSGKRGAALRAQLTETRAPANKPEMISEIIPLVDSGLVLCLANGPAQEETVP